MKMTLRFSKREKITGFAFLEMTEERLQRCGFTIGSTAMLVKFIGELKQQKVRSFSSFKTVEELKDVLRRYKVNGEEITNIRQFEPGKL